MAVAPCKAQLSMVVQPLTLRGALAPSDAVRRTLLCGRTPHDALLQDGDAVVRGWISSQRCFVPIAAFLGFACCGKLRRRRRTALRCQRERADIDKELQELAKSLELSPRPARLPGHRGKPPPGFEGGPSMEDVELMVEETVEEVSRGLRLSSFNPHTDDPLTKGMDLMTRPATKVSESIICCMGCGIPLQTHDPTNVGYVQISRYLRKKAVREHRKILCNRCLELDQGHLRPVVQTRMSRDTEGYGGHLVPAEVLAKQLATIKKRRCLVIYVMDVLDFNGAWVRKLRDYIGRNAVLAVATKIDLLPKGTDLAKIRAWLLYAVQKKRLRVLDVELVSNVTGKGVNAAVKSLISKRRSQDVVVVGAANAGKSMFIRNLLDRLEEIYPEGKLDLCQRPMVSRTPGTTLALMPLRAFRKNRLSPRFACLYDTPGLHQPRSMQNLLPIEDYNRVQPARPFGVQTVSPARDVAAAILKAQGVVDSALLQAWLGKPVRYLWAFPGAAPVAAIEVSPPVRAFLQLSFVAAANLTLTCQAGLEAAGEAAEPPEGLWMASQVFVKLPQRLSVEGEVVADVALAGFGWVAVTAKAVDASGAGRPLDRSTINLRVFGPRLQKVTNNQHPMPVAGLPGIVKEPPIENQRKFIKSVQEEELDVDESILPAWARGQRNEWSQGFPSGMDEDDDIPTDTGASEDAAYAYRRRKMPAPSWSKDLPHSAAVSLPANFAEDDLIADDERGGLQNANYAASFAWAETRRQRGSSASGSTMRRRAPSPDMYEEEPGLGVGDFPPDETMRGAGGTMRRMGGTMRGMGAAPFDDDDDDDDEDFDDDLPEGDDLEDALPDVDSYRPFEDDEGFFNDGGARRFRDGARQARAPPQRSRAGRSPSRMPAPAPPRARRAPQDPGRGGGRERRRRGSVGRSAGANAGIVRPVVRR